MAILNIVEAEREGARLLIMLAGQSGEGKTKTALEIAYGMVGGNGKKVGFLDTESGRGRLYADQYGVRYLYGELRPPFSPARYIQAIDEFSKTGVEVLIIDSGTHEWEGTGGCIDIAEQGNPKMPNWNKAKSEHKKFMSDLLSSPMHIILCLRAREKSVPEKVRDPDTGRDKTVYVDYGLQAVTEKNVMFEATVSLMMHDQGLRQTPVKVPGALQAFVGRGEGYITQQDGAAIRAWVDGAKQLDPQVEHHRGLLQMAAENGMAALQKAWGETPPAIRKVIGPKGCPEDLKASAQDFDRLALEAKQAANGVAGGDAGAVDAMNAAIAAQQQAPAAPAPAQAAPAPADDDEMF